MAEGKGIKLVDALANNLKGGDINNFHLSPKLLAFDDK